MTFALARSPAADRDGEAVHVRFQAVSKTYGESVRAVDSLSMDILRGEFLTLLGPSGSGKTTALMMLAGFEKPSRGTIFVDGCRIDRIPANRRGIGMVFQNYALFPHMTVAENLAFPLQVRRQPAAAIAERVRSVLDMVQLPGLGGRRPDQLSGGQQQRVAVARALIFEPSLVLMDEPLGALDKQLREQMQLEIKDIHARLGVTFVYVTHDQTEALTMSDRIAVFNAGTVQQLSTPAELYERPRTSFVASFIGENNRIAGTVEATLAGGVVSVVLLGGGRVRATVPNGAMTEGMPVMLSIRPERAAILGDGQAMPEELPATVRDVIYVGDHVRVMLSGPDLGHFVVKLSNGVGLLPLSAGQPVRLGWRVEDCLALDSPDSR
ncbi:MAG: ABC transporter ATP-binding protein [Kiloniellaceae bacterium]